MRGRAAQISLPRAHLRAAQGRLAQVVDHDRHVREASRKLGDVAEVTRIDAGQLQDESALIHERKTLEHLAPEDPVGIRLVMDEVADSAQLRLVCELRESLSRSLGRAQIEPGDDTADPLVLPRLREHRVGVGVGARRLHEHRLRHARTREQRLEIGRLERAMDDGVLGRHPGQLLPVEIPEVLMCVDDHGCALRMACAKPGPRRHRGRRGDLPGVKRF